MKGRDSRYGLPVVRSQKILTVEVLKLQLLQIYILKHANLSPFVSTCISFR